MAPQGKTVQNTEYVDDAGNAGTAIANAADVSSTTEEAKGAPSTWKEGQRAPKTVYKDLKSGEITTAQPERAKQVVVEGDVVTRHVVEQLKGE